MYYSLTRYIALAKARLDPSTLCMEGLQGAGKRKRKQRKWSPLEHIYIPHCNAADGKPTLDRTLDGLAYQLLRDNLLPSVVKGGTTERGKLRSQVQASTLEHLQDRSEELQRDALAHLEERVEEDMARSRGGVVLRKSIAETSLVIGCDEAGRGPLAGPVVAAAVCRVPCRSFTKPPTFEYGSSSTEPFPVADSKKLGEPQRKTNFQTFTGCSNIFDLVQQPTTRLRLPRWVSKNVPFATAEDIRTPDNTAILREAVLMPKCATVCLRGVHSDSHYRYHWGITIANHAVVDDENIFASSMSSMHSAAHGVWMELERPLGKEHGYLSTSQLLFHLYASLTPYDEMAVLMKDLDFPSSSLRDNVFGSVPRQPPLVLVDGSHAPQASIDLFSDVEIGGAAHSVVKGDARSWSIAAASNLAKVCRDDIMDMLHVSYPQYAFDSHRGYPVVEHFKKLEAHGVSPIHRRTFKPCAAQIAREENMSRESPARLPGGLNQAVPSSLAAAPTDDDASIQTTTHAAMAATPRRRSKKPMIPSPEQREILVEGTRAVDLVKKRRTRILKPTASVAESSAL
jgi:ribonuclease HII